MLTKPSRLNKKEYYTFMFLPGPNERVRTLSISKPALKAALLFYCGIDISFPVSFL